LIAEATMQRTAVILALVVAGLTGCAGQQGSFHKDDMSNYTADAYGCERDTRMSVASFGRGFVGAYEARSFAIRCMAVRGYSFW
jgi:hypothetical protein